METQDFYANINYLAVLVSAIVYFAIGAIWYSPVLFGKSWQKLVNLDMDASKGVMKLFFFTFLLTLVCVFVTATMVSATQASGAADGINIGIRLAIGFVATTLAITFLYEGRPMKLFFIDAGYHFFGIVIAAIILSVWK